MSGFLRETKYSNAMVRSDSYLFYFYQFFFLILEQY